VLTIARYMLQDNTHNLLGLRVVTEQDLFQGSTLLKVPFMTAVDLAPSYKDLIAWEKQYPT
jgi:hypothetical protein